MRLERVVLAAERHDRRVTPVACQFGKPIALQATADHDPVEHERSRTARVARGDHHFGAGRLQTDDLVAEQDLRAGGDRVGGKRLRHLGEVDNRGRRRVQGADAADVGFQLAQFFGPDYSNAGDAVGARPLLDVVQIARSFDLVERDQHLAAGDPADAADLAELFEQADAPAAQQRLVGTGLVVEARVDDAAVAPGLVGRQAVFLLEQRDVRIRVALECLAGDGHSDDATTDDRDPFGWRGRHVEVSEGWVGAGSPPLCRGPAPGRKSAAGLARTHQESGRAAAEHLAPGDFCRILGQARN